MEKRKIRGYKAFNFDFTNHYGYRFDQVGEYSVDGNARFGTSGNGYHFCERFEDTLRFFDAMNENVVFAEVIGGGDICERNDEYNGYYDMYAATSIEIVKVLDRDDIITMFTDVPDFRMIRFVQGFKLTEDEIANYKAIYANKIDVLRAIEYYQEGNKEAYSVDNLCKHIKM